MKPGGRHVAGAVALALHALVVLLLMWQSAQAPATRRAAEPMARVSVRLLNARAPAADRAVARPVTPEVAPRHRAPRAITQPTPALRGNPAEPVPPVRPDETVATTPAAPAPLVLTLPKSAASAPRSMVDAALNDPRSNSGRMTPGERFAATLGTNTEVIEERMAEGIRVRKGNTCVILRESRASALHPFNHSVAPTMKMVGSCP